jgi:hypothetical protein
MNWEITETRFESAPVTGGRRPCRLNVVPTGLLKNRKAVVDGHIHDGRGPVRAIRIHQRNAEVPIGLVASIDLMKEMTKTYLAS